MLNIAFLFGTLSGLITIVAIIGSIVIGLDHHGGVSEYIGYLIMIIALSMIFFGVKRYRDRELGGVIKFMPAFLTGLGITVVAGVIYVIVWEVYLAATGVDTFIEVYAKAMADGAQAKHLSAAELAEEMKGIEYFRANYPNPLFRLPMTFIEIFPVGVLIALISAAILRNPKAVPAT